MVYYMNRNRYKKEFKAKVALTAVKGDKTVNELASEYDIHPTQINQCVNRRPKLTHYRRPKLTHLKPVIFV